MSLLMTSCINHCLPLFTLGMLITFMNTSCSADHEKLKEVSIKQETTLNKINSSDTLITDSLTMEAEGDALSSEIPEMLDAFHLETETAADGCDEITDASDEIEVLEMIDETEAAAETFDEIQDALADIPLEELYSPENLTGFVFVNGTVIRDETGRRLILKGANLSNISKKPPYFPQWCTKQDLLLLKERGFNSIRLLIFWLAVEPTKGVFDDAYLDMIEEKIGWATEAGLYVILDMHQDLWGPKFGGDGGPAWAALDEGLPFTSQSPWWENYNQPAVKKCYDNFYADKEGIRGEFIKAWQFVATRFKDNKTVVGYDLLNEPFHGSWSPTKLGEFEKQVLSPFFAEVAAAVREVDVNHIIFVEPVMSVSMGLPSALTPPEDDNLAMAFHFYDILIHNFDLYKGGDATIANAFSNFQSWAKKHNKPWLMGEWGVEITKQNAEAYLLHKLDYFDSYQVGSMYYGFDLETHSSMALLDAAKLPRWNFDLQSRPYPQRIAGEVIDYTWDHPSSSGTLIYQSNPAIDAPSKIFIPLWPEGVTWSVTPAELPTSLEGMYLIIDGSSYDGEITVTIKKKL